MNSVIKTLTLITLGLLNFYHTSAQVSAKVTLNMEIQGICDPEEVYGLFNIYENQKRAIRPISNSKILEQLNSELKYLEANPRFKEKGVIILYINCEGKLVKCETSKSRASELHAEIKRYFLSIGDWIPGQYEGKKVDSVQMITYKIKKGILSFQDDIFN